MQNYKGYSIPSMNDLEALGHGNKYGNVYMKDPNGKSVSIGITIEDASKFGDGYIYREAVTMINKFLDSPLL